MFVCTIEKSSSNKMGLSANECSYDVTRFVKFNSPMTFDLAKMFMCSIYIYIGSRHHTYM